MKMLQTKVYGGLSLALLLTLLTACAGTRARDNVLLPAMQLAWPGVAKDVEHGVVDGEQQGDLNAASADVLRAGAASMGAALEVGDRFEVLAVDWASLRGMALRGIVVRVARGEIGAGVAGSLRERVAQFNASFLKLGAR